MDASVAGSAQHQELRRDLSVPEYLIKKASLVQLIEGTVSASPNY